MTILRVTTWVKPALVAEVKFTGLRADKRQKMLYA